MAKFKVPHDEEGNHKPLTPEDRVVYTEPYELKRVSLKFINFELNRDSTHVVWEDIKTGKQYQSDVYLLSDIITTGIQGIRSVFSDGVRIQGDFEFEHKGPHVLLTVKEEEMAYAPDANAIIDYAAEFCRRFLEKELTPGQLKREMRFFIKAIEDRKEAGNDGKYQE